MKSRVGNSHSTKSPDHPKRPATHWPAWAPSCLIQRVAEGAWDDELELIIRLLTPGTERQRLAWEWGISTITGLRPGEHHGPPVSPDEHLLLVRQIKHALYLADDYRDGTGLQTPAREEEAHYREISALARELASMIRHTPLNSPVRDYLAPADIIDLALRQPDSEAPTVPAEVALGERDLAPEEERRLVASAAGLLRGDRRRLTHLAPLLHALARDAEEWGNELAHPAHQLSPRASMKVRGKVFIRSLSRQLHGPIIPLEPRHLATLANAALDLDSGETIATHLVKDWLVGFNPAWHPVWGELRRTPPRAKPGPGDL